MPSVIILCTDGSALSIQAVTHGLSVLAPVDTVMVVSVVDEIDMSLSQDVSGHASAVFTEDELHARRAAALAEGQDAVERTAAELSGANVETRVVAGSPGQVICELAAQVDAAAIVIGSRGRGGVKRALLGSVSDFVVRNAQCPVVVDRAGSG